MNHSDKLFEFLEMLALLTLEEKETLADKLWDVLELKDAFASSEREQEQATDNAISGLQSDIGKLTNDIESLQTEVEELQSTVESLQENEDKS